MILLPMSFLASISIRKKYVEKKHCVYVWKIKRRKWDEFEINEKMNINTSIYIFFYINKNSNINMNI